jgi:putative endonuclease
MGTLYVGITSDLPKRISEHRLKVFDGFSKKYNLILLVYYELFSDVNAAIAREKNIKAWQRAWKINAIEKLNPTWRDLFDEVCG